MKAEEYPAVEMVMKVVSALLRHGQESYGWSRIRRIVPVEVQINCIA